jgi:Lambda phage tail tube protein, TTP
MSLATTGYGTKLQVGSAASPPVFTDIAEVYETVIPQSSSDLIEVTHYQSPNRRKEFIAGLSDTAEFTATMNFIPGDATQSPDTGLIAAQISGEVKPYRIIMNNDAQTSVTFDAVVRSTAPTLPVNDRSTLAVTFKPSGDMVWADLA